MENLVPGMSPIFYEYFVEKYAKEAAEKELAKADKPKKKKKKKKSKITT